jgi:FkbM family methyltransferase
LQDLPHVGSAVLDLGAHVGCFTLWALDNGASKVVSVEATPESYEYHAKNFKDDKRVTSVHSAVMSDENAKKDPTIT